MRRISLAAVILAAGAASAHAVPFSFDTGAPDGAIATASRPSSAGKIEVETGDDFILEERTKITSASFTGLLTGDASLDDIGSIFVEIYRLFPKDSQDPPSGNVPTRENSPADVDFANRDVTGSYSAVDQGLGVAANSVVDGINPIPDQTTGGEGPVTGTQVRFNVVFDEAFVLPADHYFFVPKVEVAGDENFLWLSAAKPIVGGTGPFAPDLQSWIRNETLEPDWLRIGTDVVGAGAFNASFSLEGELAPVPVPAGILLLLPAVGGLVLLRRRGVRAV